MNNATADKFHKARQQAQDEMDRALAKADLSEEELEATARRLMNQIKHRMGLAWRIKTWLKAVKHCFGWAIKEFRECYRERND